MGPPHRQALMQAAAASGRIGCYARGRRQIQINVATTARPSSRRGPLTKTTAPLAIMNRNAPRTAGVHVGARRA